MKLTCPHCQQPITVDAKTLNEGIVALKEHERKCDCNECADSIPISVRRLKQGTKSRLKVTGTEFSPASALEKAKDSISDLKVIADELGYTSEKESALIILDMLYDLEERLKEKLIWK